MEPVGADFFYDLHVPGEEHYLADGLVSHNTGKTHALCQKAHLLCQSIPGVRVLWLRKTRKSLTESVLIEFEASVLPFRHPAKHGTATAAHRDSYDYPNGSKIVLGGLDNPDSYLSTQYDLICIFEAHEATLDDWQVLISRARNGKYAPGGQMVADTNPREAGHWLNKRAKAGKMLRLQSRHHHNPRYYSVKRKEWTKLGKAYLARLMTLSGARRAWLLEGRWDTAEGPVFPEYRPEIHRISPREVPGWADSGKFELDWYFASVDWGMTAPGVLQVWGVSHDRALYRVAEVYRTGQQLDWWADRAIELHEEFDLQAIVCDPSRNDVIEHFNDRLGWARTSIRGEPEFLAFGANNKKASTGQDLGGLDAVRHYMKNLQTGATNLYLVRDCLRHGPDRDREYLEKTLCTEDELDGYVNEKNEEGKPIKDQPAKGLDDHGIDAMRYACTFHLTHDFGPEAAARVVDPNSMAAIARHDEVGFYE